MKEVEVSEAKIREVLQLFKDWRPFHSPFGGATALDTILNLESQGNYGPAGLIFTGTEFNREDRQLLLESFGELAKALLWLQRQRVVGEHANGDHISGIAAFNSLREAYLDDPGDASMVDDYRQKVAALDKENHRRSRLKPPQPPRVACVWPRRWLEKHDAAIHILAWYLEHVDLHVIFAKPMSEEEEKKAEDQNAEIMAVVQRLRVSGSSLRGAINQAAQMYRINPDRVEQIYEFRSDINPDECKIPDCDRAPFQQNMCQSHYYKDYRSRKKQKSA